MESGLGVSGNGAGAGSISFEILSSWISDGSASIFMLVTPNGSSNVLSTRGSIG